MIESPRALRISVPDLALATQWYARAFEQEPTEAGSEQVTFHVQGFTVELVQGPPSPYGPIVYWGVEDVSFERRRLLALQAADVLTLEPLQGGSENAVVYDPFGNAFGLTALGDPEIRRARNQRSAEKIALRNVRETLDNLQEDEQAQQQSRRVMLLAALAMIAALVVAVMFSALRARSLTSDKPITIPKLERH